MKTILILLTLCFISYAQTWQEYTIENGDFTIEFPGKPKEQVKQVPSEIGNLTLKFLIYEYNSMALMVSFTDYPEGTFTNANLDTFFINARNGAIKNTNGKLLTEKPMKYKEYPGREIVYSIPNNGRIRAQYFLVNNRMYQVMIIGQPKDIDNSDTKKFIASLKITAKASLSNLAKLLNEIGYGYKIADNNEYQITLKIDEERTHLVRISPILSALTSTEKYDVWAMITTYKDSIDAGISHQIFQRNGKTEIGGFQSFANDNGNSLVYSAVFHGEVNAKTLKKVIDGVAIMADFFEEKLTKADEY